MMQTNASSDCSLPNHSDRGLCIDCSYSLRGLQTHRCPECGRKFDPSVPMSMNLGLPMQRWAQRLATHIGYPTQLLTNLALAGIVWGALSLPGVGWVVGLSLMLLLAIYLYRAARKAIRVAVLTRYKQGPQPVGRNIRINPALALAMCVLSIGQSSNLGTRLTIAINAIFVGDRLHKMYAVDPMPSQASGMEFVGILLVESVHVSPDGVRLSIFGGDQVRYTERVNPDGGYAPKWIVPGFFGQTMW